MTIELINIIIIYFLNYFFFEKLIGPTESDSCVYYR